ncbi:hypothetical protein FF38_13796 [Lucilia cuprina]|uniref:Uncharacterized protein n=1 Tax=Lucilia cuprina TaxID=7375 RepID=A0A0L0C9Q0_LUCCU|nr:Histone-lysine N-methyltransferase PRDM9 [Lucilia cuprina]KNC28977.1 hypothetical protein FF38_13796 [Lucilia cuprina]
MSTISHKNLQELCRACLRTLKHNNINTNESNNVAGGGSECDAGTSSLNSLLLPNLCKLFMFLTTYDVNKEYDDFPKRLCEWCYGRLLDYDEFRKLTVRSTEMLYEQWNTSRKEEETFTEDNVNAKPCIQLLQNIKHEEENVEENDDDKLLLPELANMPLYIKPEPTFEAMDTQFILPSYLEEGEVVNRDQMSYESYDTEEDADDEELLLPNGAANNSSPSINSSDGKVVMSKRDRDRKSLHCNDCNKQFYKQVYLDAHVRGTHLGQEKPFQCSNCTKAFTRYNQLFLHIKSKHIEMLFRCDYENCDASFTVAVKLKMHRQIAHNSSEELNTQDCQEEDEAEAEPQLMELEMDHICYLCRRKYSSKRALREHIKRHKKIKEHVCQECGVAKVTRTELVTHMRTHTPNLEKFPCPQCPQVFNHKNAISRHVKVIHEGLRRFPCKYCPKRFGTRNSQVCHERLHTGERPFICEICQRGFVQPEGLRSHMKNHDKNLRKHVCKYCSQRFITLKNLVDHERRHSSDKPHICNICSKGFYSETDLKNHRSTHFEAEDGTDQQDEIVVQNESDSFL